MFRIESSKEATEEGYRSVNELRAEHGDNKAFDEKLKQLILLTQEELKSKDSETIWELFEYKFNTTF